MSNVILNSKGSFIHIPKCGGTAIQSALFYLGCATSDEIQRCKSPNDGHLFLHQMPQDEKIPFTFVRNPISWWHSFYNYNKISPSTRFSPAELNTVNFNEWVKDYGPLWLGMYTNWVRRYTGEDKNYPVSQKISIDNIGKTEQMYKDLKRILDNIKEPYDGASMHKLLNGDLPQMILSNENIQLYDRNDICNDAVIDIFKAEREIFERFNYKIA